MGSGRLEQMMLGQIRGVTTTASDLAAVEDAYSRYLDYTVVQRGVVGAATASGWGAPGVAGRAVIAMKPASRTDAWLRFVQQEEIEGWRALTTYGWSATELIIQDPDALANRLKGSPFIVIGEPADLKGDPMIRATQVVGPAGECLYLTRVGPGSGFSLPQAVAFVDRVFIAVLAAADHEKTCAFYAGLGNAVSAPGQMNVAVLSDALKAPPETAFDLAMVTLADGTLLELDGFAAHGTARPSRPGELPPGMAMVTFEVAELPPSLAARSYTAELEPFTGAEAATMCGPNGELIEMMVR